MNGRRRLAKMSNMLIIPLKLLLWLTRFIQRKLLQLQHQHTEKFLQLQKYPLN